MELVRRNEKRCNSAQEAYKIQVVANTGIWSLGTYALYLRDEETGEVDYSKPVTLRGLKITWDDINNKRAVRINIKTGELKWA